MFIHERTDEITPSLVPIATLFTNRIKTTPTKKILLSSVSIANNRCKYEPKYIDFLLYLCYNLCVQLSFDD